MSGWISIDVANIAAKEKAKDRDAVRAESLRARMYELCGEKRKLGREYLAAKKKKDHETADLLREQMTELKEDEKKMEIELEGLLATPIRSNRTPDSARTFQQVP
jgi:hypothetical protein